MLPSSWWPAAARLAGRRLARNLAALRAILVSPRMPSEQRHAEHEMMALLQRDREERVRLRREIDDAGFQASGMMKARIVRRQKCGSDAVSLWLEPTGDQPLLFRGGQCVTVRATLEDGPCVRTYSISSPAHETGAFRISVRLVPSGRLSPWLVEQAAVGDEVDVAGPSGRFGVAEDERLPAEIWLVGAGSGVTPLRSILEEILADDAPRRIRWVGQDRGPRAAMLRKEVDAAARNDARLDATWTWTRGRGSDRGRWTTPDDVRALVRPAPDALVLLCGPGAWMDLVRDALRTAGHPAHLIRTESFARTAPDEDATGAIHPVRFARSGVLVEVRDNRTLLDAARDAGLPLPYSCAMGGCGACRQTVLEGRAAMPEPNALGSEEREAGAVLACIACPRSAMVIDA